MKGIKAPDLNTANQLIARQKQLLAGSRSPIAKMGPDYALHLSDKSKALAAQKVADSAATEALKPSSVSTSSSSVASSSVEVPSVDVPSVDIPKPEVSDKLKDLAKEAADKKEVASKANEVKKLTKAEAKGTVAKPGIFFMGGLGLFSSDLISGSYSGMKDVANYVEGARYYGWDQKSDIIEEITKRKSDQPIILVGHSLGADTAVEIAEELNTLEHGFRKVDLLFTIDSWGLKNDIIPSNVKKNIHYFSDQDWFTNDGPNWAHDRNKTAVENNLVPIKHTDMDDSHDIQAHILAEIESIV